MGILQQKLGNGVLDVASVTTTFDATATSGNIILAILSVDKGTTVVNTITGFTTPVIVSSIVGTTLAYSFKVSDGTETAITQTITFQNSGRDCSLFLLELDNIDGTTPEVVAQNDSGGSSVTSLSSGTTATTTQDSLAIAMWAGDTHNNFEGARSYTNSFVEAVFNDHQESGQNYSALMVATKIIGVETAESTFSTTDTGDQIAAAIVVFNILPSADITFYLSNAEATTATVKCRVPSASSTTLEYSVNSNFTSSVTTSAETPIAGNDFVVEFNLTGLTAGTQYFYRAIEDGVTDTRNGKFKTMQAAGTPQNIKFAFAGDAETSNNSQTFSNIAALTDIDFFMHLGDLHYDDITVNTEAAYFTAYRNVFAQSNQLSMFENHALNYKWDDHDYGTNNSDGSNPTKVSAAGAFRKVIPNHTLKNPSTGSIESSWTHGRVRFIMLDVRFERDTNTILGSTQKTWFLAELASAAADTNIRFVVVSAGVPWIATSVTDTWSDAAAERTEIADKIFSEGLEDKIVFVCADAHMITHDDGTNNIFDTSAQAGWPVYQSAPLGQTGSAKGGPYSGTVFQGDTDGQYSTMEITDTGSLITVLVTGLDKNEATLYTHTFNFATEDLESVFPVSGADASGLSFSVLDGYNLSTASKIKSGVDAAIVSNEVIIDLSAEALENDEVLLVLSDFTSSPTTLSKAAVSFSTVTIV